MDILGTFIEDCCTVEDKATELFSHLYNANSEWASQNGEETIKKKASGLAFSERGFPKGRIFKGAIRKGL